MTNIVDDEQVLHCNALWDLRGNKEKLTNEKSDDEESEQNVDSTTKLKHRGIWLACRDTPPKFHDNEQHSDHGTYSRRPDTTKGCPDTTAASSPAIEFQEGYRDKYLQQLQPYIFI
ncbi:hypothetical protein Goshw_016580 [Gossypium schwendimanii]|uniref:Uncharacterized protein n=1 Tax=Gossypium schwendimanii TaxID=34291 RepID=A0A7J9KXS9_GOSSC|nr:hypothetical protein [Gossypium schwendimanii]